MDFCVVYKDGTGQAGSFVVSWGELLVVGTTCGSTGPEALPFLFLGEAKLYLSATMLFHFLIIRFWWNSFVRKIS